MADDKTTKTPEQPVTDTGPGKETPPTPPKEPEKVSEMCIRDSFQTEQVGQRQPDKEGSSDALKHYGQRHAMAVKITDVAEYQAGKDGFKAVALRYSTRV